MIGPAHLDRLPLWPLHLLARVAVAAVFFRSGQTKVEGLSVTPSTLYLFREEYRLPLLPPDLAAQMAATAEHVLPVLLVLGLASRLSALGLLAMTAVIQVFVYPGSWPEHATWAACLLLIVLRGPGPVSLDHLIGCRHMVRRDHAFGPFAG